MAATLEREQLLPALQEFLLTTVPHAFGGLLTGEQRHFWSRDGSKPVVNQKAVEQLCQLVVENAVVLDDLQDPHSRLKPPVQGARSLLLAPMRASEGLLGRMVLLTAWCS